jgi:hypothetical protein
MLKNILWIASLFVIAALVFATFGTASADAGGPPTPTFTPPPPPPTETLPFPTATPTLTLPPYPSSIQEVPINPQSGGQVENPAAATALVSTLEAEGSFSSASQPETKAAKQSGGFPLWPVFLALGLGLVLILGIVGYFVLVRH